MWWTLAKVRFWRLFGRRFTVQETSDGWWAIIRPDRFPTGRLYLHEQHARKWARALNRLPVAERRAR
jgi:hypothetical protein